MAADITEPVSSVPDSETSSRVWSLVPLVALGDDLAMASAVRGAFNEACELRARACARRNFPRESGSVSCIMGIVLARLDRGVACYRK